MKRIVSLVLLVLLVLPAFCFTGCGAVNDGEVSILWSGNGKVEYPNTLINAMERAMYIKNIEYKHYGADHSLSTQLDQAKAALESGCQVLVVELVTTDNGPDQNIALEIVNEAKKKNVPVVFFNCDVREDIINSYDQCVLIAADATTVADVQGEMIADYVKANFKKIDKNEDGKISYTVRGTGEISAVAVKKANEILAAEDYQVKTAAGNKINAVLELSEAALLESEFILTEDDRTARDVLVELQKSDYNTNKLTTQVIPIVTVGENVDYKAYVLGGRPQIPANLVINEGDDKQTVKDKNKQLKKLEALVNYYEANKYLVDLTIVDESDLDEMVYTTINVIDSGRIAGTATEDRDAIAIAVASVVRNLVKGEDAVKGVASEVKEGEAPSVVVDGSFVKVRYIPHTN